MATTKLIGNLTRGRCVCANELAASELADRQLLRARGPIGRRELPVGEGPLLRPVPATAPVPSRQDGPVARLTPLRILVVSRDRHFRTIASLLLARRNCSVTTTANAARLTELVARDAADVVVIDASELPAATMVAKVKALAQTVGIVLVSNGAGTPRSDPPVFAKWGPFEDLAAAIEHAAARRGIGSA